MEKEEKFESFPIVWIEGSKGYFSLVLQRFLLAWTTRRKRKILKGEVKEDIKKILIKKSKDLEATIERLEIFSNYLFLIATLPSGLTPQKLCFQLKKATASLVKKKYPDIYNPSMWTREALIITLDPLREPCTKHFMSLIEEYVNKQSSYL